MAFQYQYPEQQRMGLQYPQPQPRQEQQQSMVDPGTAMQIGSQFMGGGEGAAAGGGSGGGSAVASVGPWAALAAIIFANESYAQKRGYRADTKTQRAKDLFSGEVLHQDIEKRFLPKLGIKEDSKLSKFISSSAMPLGVDPGKSFKRLKDIF